MPKRLCTRCALPDSYPEITFDYQGVCSICKQHDKWTREWKSKMPKRKKILHDICARAKKKNKEFDALIPYSGDKDSTYVLYISKKELGFN